MSSVFCNYFHLFLYGWLGTRGEISLYDAESLIQDLFIYRTDRICYFTEVWGESQVLFIIIFGIPRTAYSLIQAPH